MLAAWNEPGLKCAGSLAGTYGWRHGALGLAVLNAVTLLLAGHPWTITWAFSLWGAKLAQAVGYDLSQVPFWTGAFQQQALARSVLADSVSVMDFGVLLGACLAAGLASRFAPTLRIPLHPAIISFCGGLLLGYGARIAFGCNIGAYFSGIASTSLHGWLWLVGALLGTANRGKAADLAAGGVRSRTRYSLTSCR